MSDEFGFISEKYQIQKFISRGSVSKVYLAKTNHKESQTDDSITTKLVVVKIIKKEKEKIRNRIRRELEIPRMMTHPNIIKIVDFIENDIYACFIYEYMENSMNLSKIKKSNLLFKNKKKIIDTNHVSNIKELESYSNNLQYIVNIMYQIADAIEYMHSKFIIHSDIKPQNIIIGDDRAILIDFDLSSVIGHPVYSKKNSISGTPNYMAPEIWKRNKDVSYYLSDIYSFGVTLYYVFNGKKLPYKPKSIEDMEYMIHNINPIPSKSGFSFLDKLIMLAISKDPDSRPTISEIKNCLKKLTNNYC